MDRTYAEENESEITRRIMEWNPQRRRRPKRPGNIQWTMGNDEGYYFKENALSISEEKGETMIEKIGTSVNMLKCCKK